MEGKYEATLKEILREIIGEKRYAGSMIIVDRGKKSTRIKVQTTKGAGGNPTEEEYIKVVSRMRELCGIEVTVDEGVSGYYQIPYVAFRVPPEG